MELQKRGEDMEKKIMLVCGGGASTGFLANAIHTASVQVGYDYEIFARPVDMLDNFIDDIDVLLIAPHFKFREKELFEKAKSHHVKSAIIDALHYGTMNGTEILKQINELLKEGTDNG